jgi:ABC-2 type transport system permease protein
MNTLNQKLTWLLKREMWEHKGGFIWAPAAIGLLMIGMMAIAALFAQGQPEGFAHLAKVDPSQMDQGLAVLSQVYPVMGAPILIVLAFTVFFYALGALFDERKDRSIMFWKSLPMSDGTTVASKALIALVVAPVIAVIATLATSLICLVLICLASLLQGVNLFGVFIQIDTYLTLGRLLALVPFFALSALPTVGWLMLVSAAARGKPFLWAILIPIGIALGGFIMGTAMRVDLGWTADVAGSLLFGTVPGSWLVDGVGEGATMPMSSLFASSLAALAQPGLWIGAIAGLIMLAGASYVRRRGEEI